MKNNVFSQIRESRRKFLRERAVRVRRFEERRRQRMRMALMLIMALSYGCTSDRVVWSKYRSGQFWQRVVNEEFTAEDFRENFRVNIKTFEFLCQEIGPHIERHNTKFRKCISVRKRVAISLWRLTTNCEYRTIGHLFGVARCTACIIVNETCKFITQELLARYITFPSGERLRDTIRGFEDRFGFPQVRQKI